MKEELDFSRFKDSVLFKRESHIDRELKKMKKQKRLARIKLWMPSRRKRKKYYQNKL